MLILDWKQSYEPIQVLFTLLFQLFWVGLLPILLLNVVRKFVLNLIENRLFTEETYQLSKKIFVLNLVLIFCSVVDDVFISLKSFSGFEQVFLNYIFPYFDNGILLLVFVSLMIIVKNGLQLKEEMDGFI